MNLSRSSGATLISQRISALTAPQAAAARLAGVTLDATTPAAPAFPDTISLALARWRLLCDAPFQYLIPDARLLPGEAMRLFALDPDWLDALAAGALFAAGDSSRDTAHALQALPAARAAAQGSIGKVRDAMRGRAGLGAPVAAVDGEVSGLLLNSTLVSGWPGMQIRAWTTDDPALIPSRADPAQIAGARPDLVTPILRLERLSPAVLMVLFAGTPRLIWLEEPHQGVQYGLQVAGNGFSVTLRDEQGRDTTASVAAPLRTGAARGVVDVSALAAAIDQTQPMAHSRGSAALAMQLLQAPARQRFASRANGPTP